jgi:hypothetical protein
MDQQTKRKSNGPLLQPPPAAEAFYSEVLQMMAESQIPFLVSGTYALASYTGIDRPTKDVDVFAKAGDALKMLHYFKEHGFGVEIVDERWLYRITRGQLFVDVITNMPTVTTHVTDEWFINAPEAELFGATVKLVPPTQFIWSKIFVQDHHRFDGADVAHMILKRHHDIDWKRLLSHMELYWEVLLMALLNFRFIYPSERHCVPRWLMDELLERLHDQKDIKGPGRRVCRGRIFSPRDYAIDVDQWGFSDAVGNLEEQYGDRRQRQVAGGGHRRPPRAGGQRRALPRTVHRDCRKSRRAGAMRRPNQFRQDHGGGNPRRRYQVLLDPCPRRARQSRL